MTNQQLPPGTFLSREWAYKTPTGCGIRCFDNWTTLIVSSSLSLETIVSGGLWVAFTLLSRGLLNNVHFTECSGNLSFSVFPSVWKSWHDFKLGQPVVRNFTSTEKMSLHMANCPCVWNKHQTFPDFGVIPGFVVMHRKRKGFCVNWIQPDVSRPRCQKTPDERPSSCSESFNTSLRAWGCKILVGLLFFSLRAQLGSVFFRAKSFFFRLFS